MAEKLNILNDMMRDHAENVRRSAASYETMLAAQDAHRVDRERERQTAKAIGELLDSETREAVGPIYERYEPIEFGD
jgi:hypothetical protein